MKRGKHYDIATGNEYAVSIGPFLATPEIASKLTSLKHGTYEFDYKKSRELPADSGLRKKVKRFSSEINALYAPGEYLFVWEEGFYIFSARLGKKLISNARQRQEFFGFSCYSFLVFLMKSQNLEIRLRHFASPFAVILWVVFTINFFVHADTILGKALFVMFLVYFPLLFFMKINRNLVRDNSSDQDYIDVFLKYVLEVIDSEAYRFIPLIKNRTVDEKERGN